METLFRFLCIRSYSFIRNGNPDKGTETVYLLISTMTLLIRNGNPDKGTETIEGKTSSNTHLSFRNDNPDKGTETRRGLSLAL